MRLVSSLGAVLGQRAVRRIAQKRPQWHARLDANYRHFADRSSVPVSDPLKRFGQQVGRVYAEIPILQRIDRQGRIRIEHRHYLDQLPEPMIIVAPHMANWEIVFMTSRLLNNPCTFLYEPRESPERIALANRVRAAWRPDIKLVSSASTKPASHLKQSLQAQRNLFVFVDEIRERTVNAPLLGRQPRKASNIAMVARLAISHQVPIVPVCVERTGYPAFTLWIDQPIRDHLNQPDTGYKALVQAIDKPLHQWVTRAPLDWYWLPDLRESEYRTEDRYRCPTE